MNRDAIVEALKRARELKLKVGRSFDVRAKLDNVADFSQAALTLPFSEIIAILEDSHNEDEG